MTQRHVERTHSMTAATDGAVEAQHQLLQRLEQGVSACSGRMTIRSNLL